MRVVRSKLEILERVVSFCPFFVTVSCVGLIFIGVLNKGRVGVFYILNRCYPATMAGKLIE